MYGNSIVRKTTAKLMVKKEFKALITLECTHIFKHKHLFLYAEFVDIKPGHTNSKPHYN